MLGKYPVPGIDRANLVARGWFLFDGFARPRGD
jgi:hypothetical protein